MLAPMSDTCDGNERRASLLVVDDDESTRAMLSLALSHRGYDVATASGGGEAIKALRAGRFDVLVTDIHMPDVDGLALCEVARAVQPRIGVVLITGFQTDRNVLEAFRGGASAYLRKPVELPLLFRTIGQVLESLDDLPCDLGVRLNLGCAPGGARELLSAPALVEAGLEFDEEGWVSFEAPSHRAFVDRFANLCELLLTRGVDADLVEELRVAILELGNNAIEWGHALAPEKAVRMAARLLKERLVVIVEDTGAGFNLAEVPDPTNDARELQRSRRAAGKRPGGYGIALVRAITDHIVYNDRGNIVAMVKRLRPRPSAG